MAESRPSTCDDAVVAEATDFAMKFHRLGMLADAEKFYAAVLQARPDHFDSLHLLGVLRQQQGNSIEALRLIGEALNTNSRSADAMRGFGAMLESLQRHEEALAAYDKALALQKDRCPALVSRGCALVSVGCLAEALAMFDEALAIDPRFVEALINRGVVLVQLGRAQDALAAYDQALEIEPAHPTALGNRAQALATLGRIAEVLDACDRALAVNPRDAETLYIRGETLWSLHRHEEALASYEQAWVLKHTRALSMLVFHRLTTADWQRADELANVLSTCIAEGTCIYPFTSVVFGLHPRDQLRAAKNYLRAHLPNAPQPLGQSTSVRSDKLRIAYISSDFRRHPVGLAIVDLLERHDKGRFEIIGISHGPRDASDARTRIIRSFDCHHDAASETDESVAKLLHKLGVDIAVDLNGMTRGLRPGIFAHRAAPVQVAYLGYPATTGADFIDYVLADDTVLPPDQQPFFAEKIVHLPDCYHPSDTTRRISAVTPTRGELGLPDQGVVFCCFNSAIKISAPVFKVWMRLLTQVDGSVLWLSKMNDLARANLQRAAAEHGIDPGRLIFAPYAARIEDHLARHRAADLFLDTLPYNAHSTACDALWAGLPVVTCAGASFAGRVGASMLKAAGVPELVTTSLADYEALALELATNRDRLSSIRRKLTDQRLTCPLFDGDRFRRHVEAAYAAMWNIHQRGERPRSFRVEPNP